MSRGDAPQSLSAGPVLDRATSCGRCGAPAQHTASAPWTLCPVETRPRGGGGEHGHSATAPGHAGHVWGSEGVASPLATLPALRVLPPPWRGPGGGRRAGVVTVAALVCGAGLRLRGERAEPPRFSSTRLDRVALVLRSPGVTGLRDMRGPGQRDCGTRTGACHQWCPQRAGRPVGRPAVCTGLRK